MPPPPAHCAIIPTRNMRPERCLALRVMFPASPRPVGAPPLPEPPDPTSVHKNRVDLLSLVREGVRKGDVQNRILCRNMSWKRPGINTSSNFAHRLQAKTKPTHRQPHPDTPGQCQPVNGGREFPLTIFPCCYRAKPTVPTANHE